MFKPCETILRRQGHTSYHKFWERISGVLHLVGRLQSQRCLSTEREALTVQGSYISCNLFNKPKAMQTPTQSVPNQFRSKLQRKNKILPISSHDRSATTCWELFAGYASLGKRDHPCSHHSAGSKFQDLKSSKSHRQNLTKHDKTAACDHRVSMGCGLPMELPIIPIGERQVLDSVRHIGHPDTVIARHGAAKTRILVWCTQTRDVMCHCTLKTFCILLLHEQCLSMTCEFHVNFMWISCEHV